MDAKKVAVGVGLGKMVSEALLRKSRSLRPSPLSRQSTSASASVTTTPKAVRGLTTPGWHAGGAGGVPSLASW